MYTTYHRPLPDFVIVITKHKEELEKLAEALKYEMIYNSNAIEGNTLTLNETMLVIETGIPR